LNGFEISGSSLLVGWDGGPNDQGCFSSAQAQDRVYGVALGELPSNTVAALISSCDLNVWSQSSPRGQDLEGRRNIRRGEHISKAELREDLQTSFKRILKVGCLVFKL
jgi:hypothetical protein